MPPNDPATKTPWFFRIGVPTAWLVATLVSWNHPGADYVLFLFSCLPGLWAKLFISSSSLSDVAPILIAAGIPPMGMTGWFMDVLRVRRLIWIPTLIAGWIAWAWYMVSRYPSYELAVAKNGSLAAYLAAATNLALYQSVVLCIAGTLTARLFRLRRITEGPG